MRDAVDMGVPREVAFLPFSGRAAVDDGLLTPGMLRARHWRRLFPDVYVHATAHRDDDHRLWCAAAALAMPSTGAVAGLSAAALWGVPLLPGGAPVTVCLPRRVRMWPHPRIRVIRSDLAADDVTRFTGIPLTTPVRTAFDVGRRLPRGDALVAVDALLHRRVVTLDGLRDYASAKPGWPGTRRLAEVLGLATPLAESPMETRLRLLLLDAGAPPPAPQHEVRDTRGRFVARLDLAYPRWRIGIEYEGDHHRERAQFRRDVARLGELREAGWLVLRFTADDVLRRPGRVTAQVAAAIRERRG
jgi:hypothetical protein